MSYSQSPVISADGSFAFVADISKDGRHVAFFSFGDGLVDGPHATSDVYVRDVTTGTTTLVTAGLDGAGRPDILVTRVKR
jgi:hypothetical protein